MKKKSYKPTKVEKCLITLAEYLEMPNPQDYKVVMHIMGILGIEKVKKSKPK